MSNRTCSFPECAKQHSCKGYCQAHYKQMRQGKKLMPLVGTALTLDQRIMAKISKTATCWEWTGSISASGYGIIRHEGRSRPAHRSTYELFIGGIPDGMIIDHLCHNRSCVNPDHLRLATYKQNSEHLQGAYSNNASGILGVSWRPKEGKYVARVRHGGFSYYLGRFNTAEEAGEAARLKRLELFTHNNLDR